MEQDVQNVVKGELIMIKNSIFQIKERTIDCFYNEKIYDEIIEMLKKDKNVTIFLYFKNEEAIINFIKRHDADIEYIDENSLKELSLNELIKYIKNKDCIKLILNESNDYRNLNIAVDRRGFYLKNGDIIVIPIIANFTNN